MSELIKQNVRAYISAFSNYPASEIKDEFVLKNHPLYLDNIKLSFMALSLRGYVKSLNPDSTVLATELRKSDLTVKGIYELIIKKSQKI